MTWRLYCRDMIHIYVEGGCASHRSHRIGAIVALGLFDVNELPYIVVIGCVREVSCEAGVPEGLESGLKLGLLQLKGELLRCQGRTDSRLAVEAFSTVGCFL